MTIARPTLLASAALALLGCGTPAEGPAAPPAPRPDPLRVAAASDLRSVLPDLIARYAKEPGAREVVAVYGASGQIARQIEAGAPFDLFLAANRGYASDLAARGHLRADSLRPYAVGSLTLAVGGSARARVTGLADLARPDVKAVAIANPDTAPYGAAARQALRAAGLWDTLQPRIVVAETVRQALQYVQTGNAEAGLVGRATAEASGLAAFEVDPRLYDPIVQYLGVVSRSDQIPAAEGFARFLLGPSGRAVLKNAGFALPGGEGVSP